MHLCRFNFLEYIQYYITQCVLLILVVDESEYFTDLDPTSEKKSTHRSDRQENPDPDPTIK